MVDVSCMLCSCEFFVVMMRSLCSFALQRGVCNHVRASIVFLSSHTTLEFRLVCDECGLFPLFCSNFFNTYTYKECPPVIT
jgi:hypothetical protein